MIQINLLPVRQIRARLKTRNEVAIYLASVLVLFLCISLVALNSISDLKEVKSVNKVLSVKKASYQPILNEIEKLKKNKKEQETKLEVIKKLKTGSKIAVHVMDEIVKVTPSNRLWLTSLNLSGNSLKIAGIALDNATIAQFMNKIEASDYFSEPTLVSSSQTVVAGAKLKTFALNIGITSPKTDEQAEGGK